MEIQHYIKERQTRVEHVLQAQLSSGQSGIESTLHSTLYAAMSYAVLGRGKRLRPVLAYASAEAVGGSYENADIPACAVELIHSYSLIHDDLPAMDDDNLRRGMPTCHIAYDEATAILAGDALQALAFEILAESGLLQVDSSLRLKMITLLSQAVGWKGMVAGQSIDFNASGSSMSENELAQMHGLKTGALIAASIQLGALSTGIVQPEQQQLLGTFADCIGLAFQVQDDILDVEGDTHTLGKEQGKDEQLNKPTYTSVLGLEGARKKTQELCDQGIAALDAFGSNADALIGIARYIIQRSH